MRWMEIIGVRTAASNRELLEEKLRRMVAEVKKADAAPSVTLLHRLGTESDLCIHLSHESKDVELSGSRLGLLLAIEMKAFGLVHHSIWAEPMDVDTQKEDSIS